MMKSKAVRVLFHAHRSSRSPLHARRAVSRPRSFPGSSEQGYLRAESIGKFHRHVAETAEPDHADLLALATFNLRNGE